VNRHTLAKTRFGILGLWYNGIYLFNGTTSRNITDDIIGEEFFKDISDLSVCYACFNGLKYYFYYPETGTTLSKCLIIDFNYYPERLLFYHDDFIATAHYLDTDSGKEYWGKGTSEYEELSYSEETITTSLKWGNRGFNNPHKQKNPEYIHYDIDTGGKDVTITLYADDVAAKTITVNESSRKKDRSEKLPQYDAYQHTIGLECSDSQDLVIYSPWLLECTEFGD
jgi:hypothetical protein